MKCTSKFLMRLAGATLAVIGSVQLAKADNEDSEDPSCGIVNLAYAATVNAPRSSTKTYLEQDDGSLAFFADMRTLSGTTYLKDPEHKQWVHYPQRKWVPVDHFGPKLTNCVLEGDETQQGFAAKHYSTIRHEAPVISKVDLWISNKDGRISKMRIGPWGVKLKSGRGEVEVWKFDDEALTPPGRSNPQAPTIKISIHRARTATKSPLGGPWPVLSNAGWSETLPD